jgi:hypothetical protein
MTKTQNDQKDQNSLEGNRLWPSDIRTIRIPATASNSECFETSDVTLASESAERASALQPCGMARAVARAEQADDAGKQRVQTEPFVSAGGRNRTGRKSSVQNAHLKTDAGMSKQSGTTGTFSGAQNVLPKTTREAYQLTLHPEGDGPPGVVRLRRLLKSALRSFGLRCRDCRYAPESVRLTSDKQTATDRLGKGRQISDNLKTEPKTGKSVPDSVPLSKKRRWRIKTGEVPILPRLDAPRAKLPQISAEPEAGTSTRTI